LECANSGSGDDCSESDDGHDNDVEARQQHL
jgi:hypothetical protein